MPVSPLKYARDPLGRSVAACIAVAALAAPLPAQASVPSPPGLMVDGALKPHRTESGKTFHCGDLQLSLRYREEQADLDRVKSIEEALAVTLLEFEVEGRPLASVDRSGLDALFRSFAWIERTQLWCDRGAIELWVIAMPRLEWASAFAGRGARPRAAIHTVRISPDGAVEIEAPPPPPPAAAGMVPIPAGSYVEEDRSCGGRTPHFHYDGRSMGWGGAVDAERPMYPIRRVREQDGQWVATIVAPGPGVAPEPRELDVYIVPRGGGRIIVTAMLRAEMKLCAPEELPAAAR